LNICLFTPSFLPDIGGMEIVLDELARQFQYRGHKPVVVTQRYRYNVEVPNYTLTSRVSQWLRCNQTNKKICYI